MTPPPPTEIKPRCITFPQPGLESKTWASTHGDNVRGALKEDGCFMAECGVLDGNRKELFEAPKKIFDHLVKISPGKPDFTYEKNDQSESIDILEATANKGPDMSNVIKGYIRTAEDVEKMVRNIVFGPDKLPKTGYRFQMMKYKEEARLAFPDHEDREEFLAVLDLNNDNNSEIRANINGRPSSIEVKPSTFLIMAGKPLKDWREGKIHPPELPVKMHGNEERYAVGLFSYYDKGKIDIDKGKTDKGKINIDKGKTEASKKQATNSSR